MKSRIVKRTLVLASCLFMLAGEVMPAYAAGTADDGQITEVVTEEDNAENEDEAVSENDEEDNVYGNITVSENEAVYEDMADDDETEEDTVSDNEAVSENGAVTEEDTVSENEAAGEEDAEDDNEDETIADEEMVSAEKPAGNPVATGSLGDNVTGSVYNEGGRVILYVDGKGTKMDTEFKESALAGYAITDVIFGGNVSSICGEAFTEVTSIQRVVISGSILYIGYEAFLGCTSLTTLTFEKGSGRLEIDDKAFKNCSRLNNVTIPKRVGEQVGSEGEYYGAFTGCTGLTNAALEDGIKLVPAYTFIGATALTNISIPSSVTAIGDGAFESCSSLNALSFPPNVKSIGKSAFLGTAFGLFVIPGTVTEIGDWAFMDCKALGTVRFEQGSGTLELGDGVFKNCINLNNVTLPKRVGKVAGGETSYYSIFSGCTSLTGAALEAGTAYVPKNAFAFAPALVNVTIPSSVKTIGDNAFAGCVRLGTLTMPQNLTSLGRNAFSECISLTGITIPNKVKKIPDYCFFRCSVLSEIRLPDSITEVGHRSFDECIAIDKVYCSKDKSKIKIGELNDSLKNAQWIKVDKGGKSGKEEPKTGEITLNGVAVNSLKAAFKQMKDKNMDYTIVLGSDVKGEKNLTIPKTAKSVTINGNGHFIEIRGNKFTSNVPLILVNVRIRAVDKKGALSKFSLNAKKDLRISGGVIFETKSTSVKSGGTIYAGGLLTALNVSCKDLMISGVVTALKDCRISIKNKLYGKGSIVLDDGFKPIKLGGTAEGDIQFTGPKKPDGTQILKTSAKKISEDTLKAVFGVSAIKTSAISAHLYYYNGKACIFSDAISFNGKTYGVWKTAVADMNAVQKAAKKAKTKANFSVTLNADVNMMGKFLLPAKGYQGITIYGAGHKMIFTSDISLTGDTAFNNVVLTKVNKKGEKVAGKIKKGRYNCNVPETF